MSDEPYACSDHPGDAAAYALGALEPTEAEAFIRHLEGCAVCRDEVDQFGGVVDLIALSPRQYEPPRRLRRRVMREVRATAGERPGHPHPAAARERRLWLFWRARPQLVGGLAVVVAVALAIADVTVLRSSSSGSANRTIAAQVSGFHGQADLRVGPGPAELTVRHMPEPRSGMIYEVWLKHADGAVRPTTALFSPTAAGAGAVAVPGDLRSVTDVMVTEEPAGGSPAPTSAPLIVAALD